MLNSINRAGGKNTDAAGSGPTYGSLHRTTKADTSIQNSGISLPGSGVKSFSWGANFSKKSSNVSGTSSS